MDGTNSNPPLNSSGNNKDHANTDKSDLQNTDAVVSVIQKSVQTKGLKDQVSVSDHSKTRSKPLLDRKVYSSEVSKLEAIGIPESYLDGCEKYAKYLSQSYPQDTHKILTLGKQCCMISAFLHLGAGESFEEYVISRPCSAIKLMVELCIDEYTGEVDYEKLNNIFDGLIPEKEDLDDKTLVISRNLCLIESMAVVKPYLEDYLKKKDIPFHFDFAISEVPASYVDTDACETTTKEYYLKMAAMENDPNTSVFKGPPEEINADGRWFNAFMCVGADYYIPPSNADLKYGNPDYEKNPDHQHLMDFLEKQGR